MPEHERLKAVEVQDEYGWTVLRKAAEHPESLKIILKLLPEHELLPAISSMSFLTYNAQRLVYDALDSTNKVRLAYPSFKDTRRLFAKLYSSSQNPYELVFDSLNSESSEEALWAALQAYIQIRGEDERDSFHHPLLTFFCGGYTKNTELSAIQSIVDALSYGGEVESQYLSALYQGEPARIIEAWEKQYDMRLNEVIIESLSVASP